MLRSGTRKKSPLFFFSIFAMCKLHELLFRVVFAWLAVQHRLWMSDRRGRHGLQDQPSACFTCLQDEDNVEHIPLRCVYAQEVPPTDQCTWAVTVLRERRNFRGADRRGFDTLATAVGWSLWKQCNVFNRVTQQNVTECAIASHAG